MSFSRLGWSSLAILVGATGLIAGLVIDAHTTLAAYLAMTVAVAAIPIGASGVLMITYLTRGTWTNDLHVPLTATAMLTPVAALLFIPVLVGVGALYPWVATPPESAGPFKPVWLSMWFFIGRTVFYFVVWWLLFWWSRNAWGQLGRMNVAASVGLIVWSLTVSFAGIDWIESLSPSFHSSVYGLLFVTFALLTGFAFIVTVALWTASPQEPTFAYGPVLFSAVLLWTYIHFMQYVTIWSANIPDEVIWYVRRASGGWSVVLYALIMLQFAVPFFAMLSSHVRNRRNPLLLIAAGILGLRFVESHWLVLPATDLDPLLLVLVIPASLLLVGGIFVLAFAYAYSRILRSARDCAHMDIGPTVAMA